MSFQLDVCMCALSSPLDCGIALCVGDSEVHAAAFAYNTVLVNSLISCEGGLSLVYTRIKRLFGLEMTNSVAAQILRELLDSPELVQKLPYPTLGLDLSFLA